MHINEMSDIWNFIFALLGTAEHLLMAIYWEVWLQVFFILKVK